VVPRDHRFARRARLRLTEAAHEPFHRIWVRNSQCVQVSTLKALEGDPNAVASVEELIDYDRTEQVPTRTRARRDGSDTERMEVCQPVSEATPASW
jgi:hypothetical protein